MPSHQFPPKPTTKSNDWPYDASTVAVMDPHSKGRRRPLMQNADLSKKNNPGGTGNALFQKSGPHNVSGNSSDSSSITVNGYPGWSSTMADKEYDLPEESE